jgi:hypothetical protein
MMARLTMYTATCWREGTSWTVHVAQLDRTTVADRLSEVDAAARGLIARVTGADPETVEVVVDLRVPDEFTRVLGATAAVQQDPSVISMETGSLRRSLARQLTDQGYGVQDITVSPRVSYAPARLPVGGLRAGELGAGDRTAHHHHATRRLAPGAGGLPRRSGDAAAPGIVLRMAALSVPLCRVEPLPPGRW